MKRLVFGFLLLLLPASLHAQESVPWPPDPSQIFALGVEVVSAEVVTLQPLPDDIRPTADDETRIVKAFDQTARTWKEFPYPTEATILSENISVRPDGNILFNWYYGSKPSAQWPDAWMLDPTTGVFSKPQTVCNGYIQDLSGNGEWVIFVSESDHETRMCFTETGAESPPLPLPHNMNWSLGYPLGDSPDVSPDGKWVAFMGYANDDATPQAITDVQVYSYNVVTHTINHLGEVPFDNFSDGPGFRQWVSNIRGTISYGPPQESVSDYYYTFDVTQPDSLELITIGWMYDYQENPLRYEYVTTDEFLEWKTGSHSDSHVSCEFLLYDTDGVHEYELGYDCIFAHIVRTGNQYLYVRVDENPSDFSTLVQLDPDTGEQTDLFAGEIEGIESVSPDGHYALIVMDQSGQVDLADSYFDYVSWENLPGAYLAILNTVSRKIIYQTDAYAGADIYWLDDNSLFILLYPAYDSPTLHLIDLKPNEYTEIQVNNVYSANPEFLSPDQSHIIGTLFGDSSISIIEISTGIVLPFIAHNDENYVQSYHWIDNAQIEVKIWPKLGYSFDPNRVATYTIRIPQAES